MRHHKKKDGWKIDAKFGKFDPHQILSLLSFPLLSSSPSLSLSAWKFSCKEILHQMTVISITLSLLPHPSAKGGKERKRRKRKKKKREKERKNKKERKKKKKERLF